MTMIKFLITLLFIISIWTNRYIVVRWEGIPSGNTQVFCTIDGVYTYPETIELTRFTWTNSNLDGEWIAYYDFLDPFYQANCLGYLNGIPTTETAVGFMSFSENSILYLPIIQ